MRHCGCRDCPKAILAGLRSECRISVTRYLLGTRPSFCHKSYRNRHGNRRTPCVVTPCRVQPDLRGCSALSVILIVESKTVNHLDVEIKPRAGFGFRQRRVRCPMGDLICDLALDQISTIVSDALLLTDAKVLGLLIACWAACSAVVGTIVGQHGSKSAERISTALTLLIGPFLLASLEELMRRNRGLISNPAQHLPHAGVSRPNC